MLLFLRNYVCLSGPEQGKDKMVNIIKKRFRQKETVNRTYRYSHCSRQGEACFWKIAQTPYFHSDYRLCMRSLERSNK